MRDAASSYQRTLVFTGDGKGKTTAAFGCVLRATGHGYKCAVVQFIKKANVESGEIKACRDLANVDVDIFGCGFIPPTNHEDFPEHQEAARRGLHHARELINSAEYKVVLLDEVCTAIAKGLLKEEDVLQVMAQAVRIPIILLLTGRSASAAIQEQADTVTEMRCVKHALQAGTKMQRGVEL